MNIANKLTFTRVFLIPFYIIFFIPTPSWLGEGLFTFHSKYGVLIALVIFVIASFTDFLDGYLARKLSLVTNLGKFIDPVADKILVTTALVMLVQRGMIGGWTVIIIIARDLIVDGLRLAAAQKGEVIAANVYGKIKTNFQLIAVIAYMLSFYLPIWYLPQILYAIAIIATVVSGYIYVKKSLEFIKD